jgi:leader peptidase (prepilin peptidase) / N-methyltransferase
MLEALIAGLFGLLIGSFLNVCIYRLPRDLSVVTPRSFCPECEHTIAWYDNVPVVTYLVLRAKCRRCGARIPWRYPMVELLTGVLFFAAVLKLGPNAAALKLCIFSAIQMALIFTDLEDRILPDEFTLGGLVIGLAFSAIVLLPGFPMLILFPDASPRRISIYESAFAAFFVGGLLYSLGVVYGRLRKMEVLGLGDVKMMAMIGAFLGLQRTLATLIIASVTGSIVGLVYILVARKDWREYPLPFGTFIGAAALLAAFS